MYRNMIAKATGVSDVGELRELEEIMRQDIIHGPLDWLSKRQFNVAARAAKEMYDYMHSAEGIEYMRQLAAQYG